MRDRHRIHEKARGAPPRVLTVATLAIVLLVLGSLKAEAQGGYGLRWWSADSGGGNAAGTRFSVHGTMGQHDAGVVQSARFAVTGGFWGFAPVLPATPTATGTSEAPTAATPTQTLPPTQTATQTLTQTPTVTLTPTATAETPTGTATSSPTPRATPTYTPDSTASATPTPDVGSSPTPTPEVQPTPERSIFGKVRIDGRADHGGAVVAIEPGGLSIVTDALGKYVAGPLEPGIYRVDIRYPGRLRTGPRSVALVPGRSVEMPDALLLGGDIRGDGAVDIRDGAVCGMSFGTSRGDDNYDERADFTEDGSIDISDLIILASNFGCQLEDTSERCRRWDR